jgi:hypothetical protein
MILKKSSIISIIYHPPQRFSIIVLQPTDSKPIVSDCFDRQVWIDWFFQQFIIIIIGLNSL